MTFAETVERVGQAMDALGVATIAIGVVLAGGRGLADAWWSRGRPPQDRDHEVFRRLRRRLGRAILLGLEVLVAADIIRTVAVSPTFETVGVLAVIVLIRTFLSLSLEVEIEGRWPWRRHATRAAGAPD